MRLTSFALLMGAASLLGCGDDGLPNNGDMAGPNNDMAMQLDMKGDMAMPDLSMADLTPPPDLHMPPDLTPPPADLSGIDLTGASVFGTPTSYAAGNDPTFVAIADTRGNGKNDLIVANYLSKTVGVYLGNGDGTFQASIDTVVTNSPGSVAVVDFTGDSIPDIAVGMTGTQVALLAGNGDGTFKSPAYYNANTTTDSIFVAAAHVRGTANQDLVVMDDGGNIVSVLEGNGTSTNTFAATSHVFATGMIPNAIVVQDFNKDGRPDIATANFGDNTVSVLMNSGATGTVSFASAKGYTVGNTPFYVAAADVNHDGAVDLVAANDGDNTISILMGKGDGTFTTPAAAYMAGASPVALAIGDFDLDTNLDVMVANSGVGTVSLLTGNGDGTFKSPIAFQIGGSGASVAAGSLNADTKPDVAVANSDSKQINILINTWP